jgi:CDGSH-type Zn-finger protein
MDEPLIEAIAGGPLRVRRVPLVRLVRTGGGWVTGDPLTDAAEYLVCRCGRSGSLPLCNASPPYACFEEEPPTGRLPKPFAWEMPDASHPAVALKPDGPIRVAGPTPVTDAEGSVVDDGARVSLCRCGASGCQPLCDGSHKVVGYREG